MVGKSAVSKIVEMDEKMAEMSDDKLAEKLELLMVENLESYLVVMLVLHWADKLDLMMANYKVGWMGVVMVVSSENRMVVSLGYWTVASLEKKKVG
jgi:hypothetical protein